NPAMGFAFDRLVEAGGTAIFEETGELIGCEHLMAERAINGAIGESLIETVEKAKRYYQLMGYSSFSAGNAEGGLTTIEEKSLGAYSKSGTSKIRGIIKPCELPPAGGLYLLDVVPDGLPKFGWPNINDNAEIAELIACGSHMVLFSTGRGSVVGSAISPVIKVCANPDTYTSMEDDMDINAGKILTGEATLDAVGKEIFARMLATAAGRRTSSESLGHQEFVLTYKYFDGREPVCLISSFPGF
ncbi:MAG TPA: hydrolase, partial [Anseongella sp.]